MFERRVTTAEPRVFTERVSGSCELLNFKLVLLQALALLCSHFSGAGSRGSRSLLPGVSQRHAARGGAGCPQAEPGRRPTCRCFAGGGR